MGKRKGAAIRAKKRADIAAAELVDQTLQKQESSKFEAKDDGELFVLDTKADVRMGDVGLETETNKRKSTDKKTTDLNVKQSKRNRISAKDERQIKKIMSRHSSEAIVSLAAGRKKRLQQAKRMKRIAGTATASFDLWDENAPENEEKKVLPFITGAASMGGTAPLRFHSVTKHSLRKDVQQPAKLSKRQLDARRRAESSARNSIKVEPAQPGQSYRPDEEQHQDVIGEALSIELRRKEALDYRNAPVGGGKMSEETLALLVGSSDEESSDDEDDDVEMTNVRHKRKEKLTRAQRNKQKRVKAEAFLLQEKRSKKKHLSQFDYSKTVHKELRKESTAQIARREEINALKAEKKLIPLGVNVIAKRSEMDPINAPSLPVALTDELKDGSLRTVKPKGSLLTDRMESLISRKMANRRATSRKHTVQGKRRKNAKGGKGREFMLA
jgi:nucleolar protein 53